MSYGPQPVHIRAARIAHRCDWCNERIEAGQPYSRWRWYDGGDASTVRVHPECLEAMRGMDYDDAAEGWMPGDNPRGCNCGHDEHCDKCAARRAAKETTP